MADRLLKQGLSSAAEKATLLPAAFRIPSCLLLAVEMSNVMSESTPRINSDLEPNQLLPVRAL